MGALTLVLLSYTGSLNAQSKLLQRAKEKLQQKGNETVDGLFNKDKDKNSNSGGSNPTNNGSSNGSNSGYSSGNNNSERRNMTPPDVNKNIGEAKSSFASQDYSSARFAIQQAIIGIEYELGQEILKAMPGNIGGVPEKADSDEIYSTGVGFVGLSISKEYDNGRSKYAKAQIVNNSIMLSSYNVVLSNAAYSSGNDDYRVTRIGDYRAVLEYTSNGINVAIPFGQSSLFLLELDNVNEDSEAEEMARQFDIAKFKEILGEQ